MANTNLIPGSEIFRFGGLELHGSLQSISDARGYRLPVHEYPKRDGGIVESMGRSPHRADIEVYFVGADFRQQYTRFLALLDENPKRLLVHPLLGQYTAACTVPRAAFSVVEAANLVKLQATFTESALDTRVEETPTVQGAKAKTYNLTAQILADAAIWGSASVTATQALITHAEGYVDAVTASAEDSTADPSLGAKLDAVATSTESAKAALLADPLATTATRAAPLVALCERTYAACLEAAEAIEAEQPQAFLWTVTAPTTIAALLQQLYGRDAIAYLDATLALNRAAAGPIIAAGTVLTLPAKPTMV